MKRDLWLLVILVLISFTPLMTIDRSSASTVMSPDVAPSGPVGRVMTLEEVEAVQEEWAKSRHADTYDEGQGANTTCARCKSPRNWDPGAAATEQAHDCASCKRVPGAPRPDLEGGVSIPRADWSGITCDVCHQRVGETYSSTIAFWNQALNAYEPVQDTMELCAKCHEGQHGFEVVEEQRESVAHHDWDCTKCHGPHGRSAKCTDCHDPGRGSGAAEHARHADVDCTACHDAGGLEVWRDTDPQSRRQGMYATVRFAHALTSWPSHNLQAAVDCKRCHHPQTRARGILADKVSCAIQGCHPEGAVLKWCPSFERDPAPVGVPRQ